MKAFVNRIGQSILTISNKYKKSSLHCISLKDIEKYKDSITSNVPLKRDIFDLSPCRRDEDYFETKWVKHDMLRNVSFVFIMVLYLPFHIIQSKLLYIPRFVIDFSIALYSSLKAITLYFI